jgi:hypothetical protein
MDGYLRGDGRLPQVERRDMVGCDRGSQCRTPMNQGLNGMGYTIVIAFFSPFPHLLCAAATADSAGRPILGVAGPTAVSMRRLAVLLLIVALLAALVLAVATGPFPGWSERRQ